MIVSSFAYAQTMTDIGNINLSGNNQAASSSYSWSDSYSNSSSTATGGNGFGGMGGNASNSGNAQMVDFSNPHQAPSVMMGSLFPTAPCQGTANGFLSAFIFGGLGGGTSFTLSQCEIREEARMAYSIGQPDMAKAIICMAKYAKKTPQCRDHQIIDE